MFVIDRKGDQSKSDQTVQKPILAEREPDKTPFEPFTKSSSNRPIVLEDPVCKPTDSEDEDCEETILFTGHSSVTDDTSESEESSSYEVDDFSGDDSEADSDYVRNLKENGEDFMIEDLQNMNLENFDSSSEDEDVVQNQIDRDVLPNQIDDDEYAEMAANSAFMKQSPSTMMEYSLDETAAEFLSQKYRHRKGKGKGNGVDKKKKQNHSNETPVNIFDGPYTPGEISFRQINREIKSFINDDVEEYFEMDPMPPLPRKLLHELAHMYGLKSKSSGQGRDRHCVLYKDERSSLPRNHKAVKQFIERADKAVTWMDKTVTKGKKFTQASVPKSVKESRGKVEGASLRSDTKPAVGTIVGKNAKPIAEDNVGNKLLQKLGWKPGEGLGSESDGIIHPVSAVVRGKRIGLGHSHDK